MQTEWQTVRALIISGSIQFAKTLMSETIENFLHLLMVVFNFSGEFLEMRSWKGLQQNLGATPVTKAVQGQSGIAMEYNTEPNSTS